MSPKDFYTTPNASPECLSFENQASIPLLSLSPGGMWGLPKSNTVAFRGPKWLFQYARQRLSADGRNIEIASLMGSLTVSIEELDAKSPIGLLCVYDQPNGFKDSAVISASASWMPIGDKALGRMQATLLEDGSFAPIATSMTLRGMDGTVHQHYVLLPQPPLAVEADGAHALIKSGNFSFKLTEAIQVKAALGGHATWITPDQNGVFIARD